MKIVEQKPEKKTRRCEFRDVPIGEVFKGDDGSYRMRTGVSTGVNLGQSNDVHRFFDNEPVTYYPDATLHLGAAVTEVPCD